MLEDIFDKNRFNHLARAMQKDDKKAAEVMCEKLLGKVYGFCLNRVRNQAIAEDLTQEILLKLVDKIELYNGKKGDFVVWFWRLARNTVFDHYRRQKEIAFADLSARDGSAFGGENEEEILGLAENSPQDNYDNRLKRKKLNKLLDTFTEEEQEIFRLRFLGELSYKEMAGILEKSEGALRVAVNRLKKKVKSNLDYGSPT